MKKLLLVPVAALLISAGVGCGGPQIAANSVGDWYAQKYNEVPWLYGNVLSYGIYSFVHGACWFVDGIINVYFFWGKDAQPFGDGKGTTFEHKNPSPGKKY